MSEYAEAMQQLREAGETYDATDAAEAFRILREKIEAAFEEMADALAVLERGVVAIIEGIKAAYKEFLRLLFEVYPNKRVLHLARYGKGRTKKKNINRIIKWLKRKPPRVLV